MMSQKIERLEQLQNKIDQLTEYCQELEKWRSLTVLPQDLAQFHFCRQELERFLVQQMIILSSAKAVQRSFY